jgi:hypothetical protein
MLTYFHRLTHKMRNSAARKSKLILIPAVIAFVINILIIFLIYFKIRPIITTVTEGQTFTYIPLHYNIYTGIDSYGRWERLFYLPLFGEFVFAVNFFVAFLMYNKKEILSYLLSVTAMAVQIILLVAIIFVILINI